MAPHCRAPQQRARPGDRDRTQEPGVAQVITIAGVSALDNNSTLANGGVAYVILKDWSERGKGEDLRSLFAAIQSRFAGDRGRAHRDVAAAADPGHRQCRRLHHADRAARRQLRSRQAPDHHRHRGEGNAQTQSGIAARDRPRSAPRVPQYKVDVDRAKAETLQVSVDEVFSTLAAYLGSSLCRSVQQVRPHVPGLRTGRFAIPPAAARTSERSPCATRQGSMIPLGTLVKITPDVRAVADQPLQPVSVLDGDRAAGAPVSAQARPSR